MPRNTDVTNLKINVLTKNQYDAAVVGGTIGQNEISIITDLAAGYLPDLFDWKWADHRIDDPSWVSAHEFYWLSGRTYDKAYQHLLKDAETTKNFLAWYNSYLGYAYTTADTKVGQGVYWKDGNTGKFGYYMNTPLKSVSDTTIVNENGVSFTRAPDHDETGTVEPHTETIAGITITYYLAQDGHKVTTEESNAYNIYEATGVAWYYVLDKTNQRFKLPRTKFGVVGFRDGLLRSVGDYVEPELPNITFTASGLVRSGTGALTSGSNTGSYCGPASSNNLNEKAMSFSAANSSSVYKDNGTVQPPASEMFLYFYVGEFTKPAIVNAAGLNMETINNLTSHVVIKFQAPDPNNNYKWYRLYMDGWVEQGGIKTTSTSSVTETLPITMADRNYQIQATLTNPGYGNYYVSATRNAPTSIGLRTANANGTTAAADVSWYVYGMAADNQ